MCWSMNIALADEKRTGPNRVQCVDHPIPESRNSSSRIVRLSNENPQLSDCGPRFVRILLAETIVVGDARVDRVHLVQQSGGSSSKYINIPS